MSEGRWRSWAAYRIDARDDNEQPELAFYCPDCAREEFEPQG